MFCQGKPHKLINTLKFNLKLLILNPLTTRHADAREKCDPQLNKTVLATLKVSEFNYEAIAVLSGMYVPSDTHVFCEYRAVKEWKQDKAAHA